MAGLLELAQIVRELFKSVAVAGGGGVGGNGERLGNLQEREAAPGFHDDHFAQFGAEVLDGIAQQQRLLVLLQQRIEPDVLEVVEIDDGLLTFFAAGFAAVQIEAAEANGGKDQGQVGRAAALILLIMPEAQDGLLQQVLGVLLAIAPAAGKHQQTRAVFGQPSFPSARGVRHHPAA